VNPGGPSLKFNAGLAVSDLPSPGVSGLSLFGMLDEKCKTAQKSTDH
jgi:hypothetical protein